MRMAPIRAILIAVVLLCLHGSLRAQDVGSAATSDHTDPHEPLVTLSGPGPWSFPRSALKDAEVVSLAESIHMTHEFPLARIGMVRWLNAHLGFHLLALEGSPEDLWVSQDAFLRNPSNLTESTSGLFGVWNTPEMEELFAYQASTWRTDHPLYITSYDIQPGTGRGSRGARVFQLLAQRLTQYAPPPVAFNAAVWASDLGLLTSACSQFKPHDTMRIESDIALLYEWVDRAARNVKSAFPSLPHAAMLRMIPENLNQSLALCEGYTQGGASGAGLYKTTRDRTAAQFALWLKEIAPGTKLILWAHVSHLSYDAEGSSTSVGEILHLKLGPKLYTVGTFAEAGGAIMLFSDWNDIIGYGRVWGVSGALKRELDQGCGAICFVDLRSAVPGSAVTHPEWVWFEAIPKRMVLAKDFDGIIWVRRVHPPQMPLSALLAWCSPGYWRWLSVALLALLLVTLCIFWIARALRRSKKAS